LEYRQLGGSGLKVPALSFGNATFGRGNEFFRAWGSTDVQEARRLIDVHPLRLQGRAIPKRR
jgi:aryl-alcohol dehydrogenase-like predicted oxidoreductase